MKIALKNIIVRFEDKEIRVNNRFEFKPGINIISGPNGQGKTTLLKAIYKQQVYSGEITINEEDISKISKSEISKLITYVSQENQLFEEFTANEHLKLLKVDEKKFKELIKTVRKEQLLDKKIKGLSGGEKQLINLFLGLAQKSEYLLIDEPLNNISVVNKKRICDILAAEKRGMIIVSHQPLAIKANLIDFEAGGLRYV